MNKMLLAVDCQYDFIDGSLAAKGSSERIDRLAKFVEDSDYAVKVFTADWHPYNHSSFKQHGGIWPRHCVRHTHGASIYQPLVDAAIHAGGAMFVLEKGDARDREEYSIFDNADSAERLMKIFQSYEIDQVDICGIATEYCVKESLEGAIERFGAEKMCVLDDFVCPIEDEHALDSIIEKFGITRL